MEEGGVAPRLLGARLVVVVHARGGRGLAEHDGEQGSRALDAVRDAGSAERVRHDRADLLRGGVDAVVHALISEFEGAQAGDRGQGVAREGTRLVDGAQGGQQVHDVRAPGDGRQGHAAAHDLAEGHEVGHPVGALHGGRVDEAGTVAARGRAVDPPGHGLEAPPAGGVDAEAGEDLVEDHERAVRGAQAADLAVPPGVGRDRAHVGGCTLEDDGGDTVTHLLEARAQGIEVVVGQDDCLGGDGLGDAGRPGQAAGGDARPCGGEQAVGMAVVIAGEFHDEVAPGGTARQADRRHRRLGARRHEADALREGHALAHGAGQQRLSFGRRTEGQAARGGLLDGGDHLGVRVAEQRRAPRADQVHVGAPLHVGDARTARARDEARGAADAPEGAHGRVHAAGDHGFCLGECGFVSSHGYLHRRKMDCCYGTRAQHAQRVRRATSRAQ